VCPLSPLVCLSVSTCVTAVLTSLSVCLSVCILYLCDRCTRWFVCLSVITSVGSLYPLVYMSVCHDICVTAVPVGLSACLSLYLYDCCARWFVCLPVSIYVTAVPTVLSVCICVTAVLAGFSVCLTLSV